MIKINKLITKNETMSNSFNNIVCKSKDYNILMNIYFEALNKVEIIALNLKRNLNLYSGYEVINNVTSRIKNYDSIINKIKKKGYDFTYKSLIENINDIAGLRIICMSNKDIYKIQKIISNIPSINILREKDYIKKPKKSGYSAYHIIIEVPVNLQEKEVWVKVEIQIRTIAMDLWANLEHKIKYKSNVKISKRNSKKLKDYSDLISKISEEMQKMYRKSYKYIEN